MLKGVLNRPHHVSWGIFRPAWALGFRVLVVQLPSYFLYSWNYVGGAMTGIRAPADWALT